MGVYLSLAAVPGALMLGFLAGLLTYRNRNQRCTACNGPLSCRDCLSRAGVYPTPHPR